MIKVPGTLTEADITRQIRDVLERCGIWHWKQWSGPMTYPKGICDILGVWRDGRFLAIEIKKPGGVVSPHQKKFIERMNKEGGIAFVAYSVDDVIRKLGLNIEINPLFNQRLISRRVSDEF